jgi:hypothetical protein
MREAIVILIVIAVLLGLTAVRYRKQIVAMLHVWRMLKQMRGNAGGQINNGGTPASQRLVSCAKCGTWVPESSAMRIGPNTFYCSKKCMAVEVN